MADNAGKTESEVHSVNYATGADAIGAYLDAAPPKTFPGKRVSDKHLAVDEGRVLFAPYLGADRECLALIVPRY